VNYSSVAMAWRSHTCRFEHFLFVLNSYYLIAFYPVWSHWNKIRHPTRSPICIEYWSTVHVSCFICVRVDESDHLGPFCIHLFFLLHWSRYR
jgi:hypothetical protein